VAAVLANCSALGVFRFDWRSKFDNAEMSVQWGAGLGNPLAFMNGMSAEVRNPERFGFKRPVTLKNFKEFAQAFADEYESGED
jgi:hypothetical protein